MATIEIERNIQQSEENILSGSHNENQDGAQWYALWVYRNLTAPVVEICRERSIEHYIPVRLVERFGSEGIEYREEPVISGLMFIRTTLRLLTEIQRLSMNRAIPYRHPGTSEPAAIDDRTMEIFIFVTRTGARQIEAVEPTMERGDKVRVTDGLFKGAEGYIRRVHGTKRFIVAIEGIAAIAVTHIPRQFLEKITPEADS